MEDYAIIYNPEAGKGKGAKKDIHFMKKCLDELNISYKLFETKYGGHAIELGSQLAKDGYEFIRPKVDEVAEAFKRKHGRYFWDCNYD